MQDLKYFVDIVESVHSGGASLFGLKTAQISQLLLHSHEKHHLGGHTSISTIPQQLIPSITDP